MKKCLVTGASGFIGSRLCEALAGQGLFVRALMRSEASGSWSESRCIDLSSQPAPRQMLEGVDTVFHLAGKAHALAETKQDEEEYFRINTEGTRLMLEAAKEAGVRRFVLFSSVKVVGEGGYECLGETASCQPETPYGASKLAAEKLVLEGGYVPEPVVLRPSMVYGPSEKGNLPRMIAAVRNGRFPPLPDVNNRRSMVHVDDMVAAAILAAERSEAVGEVFNVTDGTPYSTRQIYEWICEAVGRPLPNWDLPLPLLGGMAKVGDMIGYVRGRRFLFDSDALDKLIGSACYSSTKIEQLLTFLPAHHLRDSLPAIVRFLDKAEQ